VLRVMFSMALLDANELDGNELDGNELDGNEEQK
jgi:hypothetical protein